MTRDFEDRAQKRREQEVHMKSHVGMEQHVCLVCTVPFDTGNILLDTRVRNGELMQSLDPKVVTGWGLCPQHQKLYDDGFIALIGCDESKSSPSPDGTITPANAYRTGGVAHLRSSTWARRQDDAVRVRVGRRDRQAATDGQ
jgi:hypothetical protein